MTLPDPTSVIAAEGPWTHRAVAANGARFHVAELGQGPMVLMLHGFPMFWWTWRTHLLSIAEAGYRAVAMDLRGYGGSDRPPRGYDPYTLSADVAGVIGSLGAEDATIVGHGWGGFLAWTTAALHPGSVRAIAPVAMAHPCRLRDSLRHDADQRRASRYAFGFQRPWIPERHLVANDAAQVGDYLSSWSASDGWLTEDMDARYRSAFSLSNTAHCAVEYYRWAIRSIPRSDGRRFFADMTSRTIDVPVLQVQGALDPTMLPRSVMGSRAYTGGPYAWRTLHESGHFPQEEQPADFSALILAWLDSLGGPDQSLAEPWDDPAYEHV